MSGLARLDLFQSAQINMALLLEFDLQCPHCGEVFPITLDSSQGDHSTIEDCSVCCRPIQLQVSCEPGEIVDVSVARG